MRKSIAIIIFAVLAISLAACSAQTTDTAATDNTLTTGASETQSTPNTPSVNVSSAPSSGSSPSTESTAPHEHAYTSTVTPSTCTQDGATLYTCTCGSSYSTPIEKIPHSYTSTVTAPTCTQDGYTAYTCACGDTYVSDKAAAAGHSFGEWNTTKKPTTSATGLAERTCSACGHKESKELPREIENHTHSYTSAVTRPATCSVAGVMTYTCSCGAHYTESIAKTAHTYTSIVTSPTCSASGYTTYTCSCGDSYIGNKTNALGHKITSTQVDPSCVKDGYWLNECTNCSYSFSVTLPKFGHHYVTTIQPSTCTAEGYTNHYCVNCRDSYNDTITPALGHDYQITLDTAPTCTTVGYQTKTCSRCNDQQSATYPATGHQHTRIEEMEPSCSVYTKSYIKTVCDDCGEVISQTENRIPHGATKTMLLSDACQALCDRGISVYLDSDNAQISGNVGIAYAYWYEYYTAHVDWVADVCVDCGWIFNDTIRFAHTQQEAAQIMCDYINELRAEVYGTHEYDLVVHEYLVRACDSLMHTGSWPSDGLRDHDLSLIDRQMFRGYSENLLKQFNEWKENSCMYELMLDKNCKYFGFAYDENDHATLRYAPASLYTRIMFAQDM